MQRSIEEHSRSEADSVSGSPTMTIERLREFDDAWGRRDIDALMEFITDDCEYHASVGPEPGERFIGKDEVRRGFQELLNHDAGRVSRPGKLYVYGNRGVAEWSYVDTDESGQSTIIRGCDLFEFDGDMIKLKNAFRKCQL